MKYKVRLSAILTDENPYEWEDGMRYNMAGAFKCLLVEEMRFLRRTQRLSSDGYDGLSTKKLDKFKKIVEHHGWQDKFNEFEHWWADMMYEKQNSVFGE